MKYVDPAVDEFREPVRGKSVFEDFMAAVRVIVEAETTFARDVASRPPCTVVHDKAGRVH